MSGITVRSLGGFSMELLTRGWNVGFSDYKVSLEMTQDGLLSFMRQNGVQLERSVGALSGENLVGFWLNGVRERNGVSTAYDSGTAIISEFRGMKISERMAKESDCLLREAGVKEYFLEVISDNTRAKDIYIKNGFKVTRELICLKTRAPLELRDTVSDDREIIYEEMDLDDDFWCAVPAMEYRPSRQNSNDAVLAIAEQ